MPELGASLGTMTLAGIDRPINNQWAQFEESHQLIEGIQKVHRLDARLVDGKRKTICGNYRAATRPAHCSANYG